MIVTRRNYFIKKNFQTRFILRFVVTTTIWAVAAVSLFVMMAERRIEDVLYSPHINVRSAVELVMPSLLSAHLLSLILFTVLLLLAVRGLWKRLSPPLYSLKRDIMRLAAGDLVSGIALSEGDEFQDLAADLDRMRSGLRERFIRLKERQKVLSESAAELQKAVLKSKDASDELKRVKDAIGRMKEELDGFSL